MIFTLYIFLMGIGIVLFVIGCYTRRISLLGGSLVVNFANILAPWATVCPTGYISQLNTTTNITYVTYTYGYLDYSTKVVLSMLFTAFTLFTILQFWNVVSIIVRRGVEKGEEVDMT